MSYPSDTRWGWRPLNNNNPLNPTPPPTYRRRRQANASNCRVEPTHYPYPNYPPPPYDVAVRLRYGTNSHITNLLLDDAVDEPPGPDPAASPQAIAEHMALIAPLRHVPSTNINRSGAAVPAVPPPTNADPPARTLTRVNPVGPRIDDKRVTIMMGTSKTRVNPVGPRIDDKCVNDGYK